MQKPLDLLEYSGKRRLPIIMQTEIAECGLACLAMVSSYYGHKLDIASLRSSYTASFGGMNFRQMISVASNLNLSCRALKCQLEDIGKLTVPCILHWDLNHFVVLTGVSRQGIYINDPAAGKRKLTLREFSDHYTGVALELIPTSNFKKGDSRESMRLSQLWTKIVGLKSGLISLLALSLVLQFIALTNPYYMQWVIDEVLLSQDKPLLMVLAIGFALLTIINTFSTAVRSYLILRLSSMLNMQMGVNLLRHLLKLPMSYFEKRHIGDLVSRFSSLNQIRERLTTGVTETIMDGFMSITVLTMMFVYSTKLTLVVIFTVIIYILLRILLYPSFKRNTEEMIQSGAKEQSNFLETIRGIQTIKLHGNEHMRQSLWQNRYAELINAEIRLGKLDISFKAANNFLFGLENIAIVYFSAFLVMDGLLTVGMLLAFMAYKGQFTSHIVTLVEQIISFRMMKLHLERISDIALSEIEKNRKGQLPLGKIKGELRLENVSFKYGNSQPWIVKNCNLTIKSGESLAIIGNSGCGKSTLMKLMLGLLEPNEGRILIDGKDVRHIGLVEYRKQIAAVMQDDTLLTGSVLDNITFFDPEPNLLKVQKAANQAAIDVDITSMPMAYNSLVGDMGSQFSGGQIQRLLLARAFYKEPKILFLDEATSHLDVQNELNIGKNIKSLTMTRIIVAHRPETINQVDRIVILNHGVLSSLNANQIPIHS
ncbi:Papain-like cysteine protease AvrRpt2 [Vibrio sp. B1REV9]|uniref:peptidase domain-containing ABC transporter n=1 Tax=Vibrio sp. B1REV9 TaxID=2751179 RepID=UPI001AFCC33A|nr:peptidase domain-containing ABC transporter [Vibrio sp. B1REV9]CAE6931321.1 Papain-like cysteine protease AvrRpt2 [Vibrio sp. B1REV9]